MKIILNHVSKSYDTPIFTDISHTFESGKLYVIKGISGSGKSTLLHIIAGIDTEYQGTIQNDRNENLSSDELMRQCAFMSQYSLLLSNLTVLENLQMFCGDRERIDRLMQYYHLYDKLNAYPEQLSGGERQRVSCIRALLSSPQVLLADEPTASLDQENAERIAEMLNSLKCSGTLVIAATHESCFDHLADEIIGLKNGIFVMRKISQPSVQDSAAPVSDSARENKIPLSVIMKRNPDIFRFKRLIGYLIMFLMLFSIIFISANAEQIMTAYMKHRYPLNVFNFSAERYAKCGFADRTVPYWNYVIWENGITGLYLASKGDSVLNIKGMIASGRFPVHDDEVLISHDLALKLAPNTDIIGSQFTFYHSTYTITGVLHPFTDESFEFGYTFLSIYDSDAYYFRKYGEIVFIPYNRISAVAEPEESSLIRVRYPALYDDAFAVSEVRASMEGSPISLFDNSILDFQYFAKWIGLALIGLFFVCFFISCIFMHAQIGIELFYRKKEVGYLQIFGMTKKKLMNYIITGYLFRIIIPAFISVVLTALIAFLLRSIIHLSIGSCIMQCAVLSLLVAAIYTAMVYFRTKLFLKTSILTLIV
jgi:putative ABC transport system ATP-binding protein